MKYTGEQDKIADMLNNYIEENGVKINFIASKIGIARETLSRFKNKKMDLHKDVIEKIVTYIRQR